MAKYTFSAVVNYPETEVETPIFTNLTSDQAAFRLRQLLDSEPDLTSTLITIVKQKED